MHWYNIRKAGLGQDIRPAVHGTTIEGCLGLYIEQAGTVEIECRGEERTVTCGDHMYLPVSPTKYIGGTAVVHVVF